MNIKEYIESGIVGSYVLGLASEAEQHEFKSLCGEYPELIEAMRSFELALEAQMIREAVAPPADLKQEILSSLNQPGTDNKNQRQLLNNSSVYKMNVWKSAAAACALLLACTIYFAYSLNEKYKHLQTANAQLENSINQSGKPNPFEALNPIVQKSSVKWSAMLEPKDPLHCMAHIYWDSVSTNTFLLIGNIPQTVADRHFQLWAIINNNPIYLGVFDRTKQGQLVQMKNVQIKNVQTPKKFIITIQPKDERTTPAIKEVYAVGKI